MSGGRGCSPGQRKPGPHGGGGRASAGLPGNGQTHVSRGPGSGQHKGTVEEVETMQCSLLSFGFKRDTAGHGGQSPDGRQGRWAQIPPGHSTVTLSRSAHLPGSASPSVTCGVAGACTASGTLSSSAMQPCPKTASRKVLGTFEGVCMRTRHLHSSLLLSPSGKQHYAPCCSRNIKLTEQKSLLPGTESHRVV